MKWSRRILVALAVALVVAPPAAATTGEEEDPEEDIAYYTSDDYLLEQSRSCQPAETATSSVRMLASRATPTRRKAGRRPTVGRRASEDDGCGAGYELVQCRTREKWVVARNVFGWARFSFGQRMRWCWNGRHLTSAWRSDPLKEIYSFVWDYKGIVDSWAVGGRYYTYFDAYVQGKFQKCTMWGCIQTKLPWVEQVGYRGGGYWANGGGT